jgi:hypothetical protein
MLGAAPAGAVDDAPTCGPDPSWADTPAGLTTAESHE